VVLHVHLMVFCVAITAQLNKEVLILLYTLQLRVFFNRWRGKQPITCLNLILNRLCK